jgi:hypothetical protein
MMLCSMFGAAVTPAAPGPAPAPGPARPRSEIRGEVSVREVELSAAIPDGVSYLKELSLNPSDFVVLRDGEEQPVVRAERLDLKDRPYTAVVWVDRVLASPTATFATATRLASRARDLVRMGTVDVVVADPGPRVELSASTEALAVRTALEDTAAAARRDGDRERSAGASFVPHHADAADWRRQGDRLIAWVAARHAVGPRVLFLPLDAVDLSLSAIAELGTDAVAEPGEKRDATPPARLSTEERAWVDAMRNLERALAAYGWTTLVLIDRPVLPRDLPDVTGAFDRWHRSLPEHGLPGAPVVVPWGVSVSGGARGKSTLDPRTLDAELDPRYAAPRLLAQETGGFLVTGDWDLPQAFDALAHRWRLWMRAPEGDDEAVHEVRVKIKGGGEARTARWLRSATPQSVSEARLRTLLEGDLPAGAVALDAKLATADDGSVEVDVRQVAEVPGESPVHWHVGARRADGSVVLLAATQLGEGMPARLRVQPPSGARNLAVSAVRADGDVFGYALLRMP